jgi:hypothetical protein
MPGNVSFNYAIFKRLQAAFCSGWGASGGGHLDLNNPMGGFSLLSPNDPHGLKGTLGNDAPAGLVGLAPLAATNTPADSPIYQMLSNSLGMPGTVPANVQVGAKMWPTMPPPEAGTQSDPLWLEFNNGAPPPLVTAFANWISNGKPDDSPQDAPLGQPGLFNSPPPTFPNAPTALLFVASFAGDDGRRTGDGEAQGVPLDHVPLNFWATSQIFLVNDQGKIPPPAPLKPGDEWYVSAIVGNSCATEPAGRTIFSSLPMIVICDAQCFNTFMSPAVPLPSFGNLDPTDINPNYEQFVIPALSYDVVAFRFNVSNVFSALAASLQGINLGGTLPADWLKAGHPCVKVLVTSGEQPNYFPPMGSVPLTIESSPRYDRHIAQHNLQPFDSTLMALAKPLWTNFILAQAGQGLNGLTIRYLGWPTDLARFYFAIPSDPFERFVVEGGHGGFEIVRDGVPKPFPDAVILRQMVPGSRLEIADHDAGHLRDRHGPDRFFGMALGIEADAPSLRGHPLGDVEVVHTTHDGDVVGGFSLRPVPPR